MKSITLAALGDYLAGEGHRQAVEAFFSEARENYRVALDKLAHLGGEGQMQYLNVTDVARFNADFVGEDKPFDFGRLESAVMRPQATVGGVDACPTLHDKAAALMHSLISNHPFLDGNKRTALAAVVVFYRLNGWALEMEQGDAVNLALDIAIGQSEQADIAKELADTAHAVHRPW